MEETIRRGRSAQRRKAKERKRLMIVGGMMLIVGLAVGFVFGADKNKDLREEVEVLSQQLKDNEAAQKEDVQQTEPKEEVQEPADEELPWNLVLVNPWNAMEEGYVPELIEVETGQSVDSRIAEDLKNMLADAKSAGLSPFICSAYRSVDRQEQLFNNKIERVLNTGLGYYDAYVEAAMVVAVPGTSEHALGLAVDIVSNSNMNLDESQENTAEFQWFKENCYKYGFILRYPNGTTEITGIIYEPWHYRYVGIEAAKEITELGVTLEEYLENHYGK